MSASPAVKAIRRLGAAYLIIIIVSLGLVLLATMAIDEAGL